jgi:hypothetical protein
MAIKKIFMKEKEKTHLGHHPSWPMAIADV